MKELENLAKAVCDQLNIEMDEEGVKFIEGFIERHRFSFDGEQKIGLINSVGSYIGQCLINNYGGQWQYDAQFQTYCVAFNENNKVFPFAKTGKQFENGLEDSVYSFYRAVPVLFKIGK